MHLVQFGAGEDGPAAALAGLGYARPVIPAGLAFIEQHFDDPRHFVRSAAFAAAGHAGAAARPLIDSMIVQGRRWLRYSTGTDVARALERIVPEDPRVVRFLDDHASANRRRRLSGR